MVTQINEKNIKYIHVPSTHVLEDLVLISAFPRRALPADVENSTFEFEFEVLVQSSNNNKFQIFLFQMKFRKVNRRHQGRTQNSA